MTTPTSGDNDDPLPAASGGDGSDDADRRGGGDRRDGTDRRSGRDRRGQPRPAWTALPDPTKSPQVRPYCFRSLINRREFADRRVVDRRLGNEPVELSQEELDALLGPDES